MENSQDIIPSTERSQDTERTAVTNDLTLGGARPLTDAERTAADRDTPAGKRVYAPASKRVAVDPLPGHRDFVNQTDTHTPEREAAGRTWTEPAFTSVPRPTPAPTWDDSRDTTWSNEVRSSGMSFGWVLLGIGGGLGGWLFLRWQRERNKPINRLRRQAKQAASELRDRVPSSPEEAVRPAAGLTTALLSIAIILWRQAQSRSHEADKVVSRQARKVGKRADKAVGRATNAVSDLDWQKRLTMLKKHWNPGRLELEKISISRH